MLVKQPPGIFKFQHQMGSYISHSKLLMIAIYIASWSRLSSWLRHQMETFSSLLAICAENSPVTVEVPSHRPLTRSFNVFFDLHLSKWLSKQSWGWRFETTSLPLWRHCTISELQLGTTFYVVVLLEISCSYLSTPNLEFRIRSTTAYSICCLYNKHVCGIFILSFLQCHFKYYVPISKYRGSPCTLEACNKDLSYKLLSEPMIVSLLTHICVLSWHGETLFQDCGDHGWYMFRFCHREPRLLGLQRFRQSRIPLSLLSVTRRYVGV